MPSGQPHPAASVRRELVRSRGPYDGARLLDFLGRHAVPGVETWDGFTYRRTLRLDSSIGALRAQPASGGIDLTLHAAPDSLEEAATLARHLLGPADDPTPAERHLATGALAPLVAQRPGLRLPGSVDGAETVLRTVVGQQISLAGARTLTGRLVTAYGSPAEGLGPGLTHTFPAPRDLAGADPAHLPLTRARGRALVGVAAALADGVDPGDTATLLALPGIGPWTADYVALRVRRDPDVFLPTDLAARRRAAVLGLPDDPTALREHAERWRPWRSYALMHLWTDYLEAGVPPGRRPGGA